MIDPNEVLTSPWGTVSALVTPIVGGVVLVVRWIISRSDRDRETLERRMDEDRRALVESLGVLKELVSRTSNDLADNRSAVRQMMDIQARIAASQDSIARNMERISAIIEAGERQTLAHKER